MNEALSPIDEMYLEGLEMKRAQFRRLHPGDDEATIEEYLRAWILDRPMDALGRARPT